MHKLITLIAFLGLVGTANAQVMGTSDSALRGRATGPSTLEFLSKPVPEVAFEEAPLESVMNWLAELSDMNVRVRWEQLESLGIDRDKPITIQVRNVRLSQVLWMIMNAAGGVDVKLAYRASGNILTLSTDEDLGKEMVTETYDVSDLLLRVPNFYGAPSLDLQQNTQQGQGGGGGGQSIFSGSGGNQDDNQQQEGEDEASMQELIDLIQQTVEPNTWFANGGLGTIHPFQGSIVVRNNLLVHQKLGGYVRESD